MISLVFQTKADIKIPEAPNPPRLVNDFAGMLSAEEQAILENKLVAFNDSTSNEITVVIVNDLGGYEPVDYATEIGRKWLIGGKKKNNGIVLLISKNEHKIFIAVGTGLQGALPDGVTELIIQHEIKPSFKQNNFYEGLDNGTTAIMLATKGEYKADAKSKSGKGSFPILLLIIIIIIVIVMVGGRNNRGGGTISGGGFNSFLLGSMLGSSMGGGGFGGSGSSSGGGGFGGFGGGGGFDGGGAGGSW